MNSVAEILLAFEAYERDLRDTLSSLGDREASPETLENAARRAAVAGTWLKQLDKTREVLNHISPEDKERMIEAERSTRELRALITSAASERASEIASALNDVGKERKRLDGYRHSAESGGSCNMSA